MTVSTILGGPKPQFFDGDGGTLGGGTVEFFAAGTSTPLDSYTDSSGLTPNTNPVLLDSRGEPPNGIYATDGLGYKIVLKDPLGAVLWTVDNAFSVATAAGGTGVSGYLRKTISTSINYIMTASDNDALVEVTGNTIQVTLLDSSIAGIGYVATVINNANGAVTVVGGGTDLINGISTQTLRPGEHVILTSSGAAWNGPQTFTGLPIAVATGAVNAMVVTFEPIIELSGVSNGVVFQVKPFGQITVTAPTLSVNGAAAKTIVNSLGTALLLTDIQSSSQTLLLQFDAVLNSFVLLNNPPPLPPVNAGVVMLDSPLLVATLPTNGIWVDVTNAILSTNNATSAIFRVYVAPIFTSINPDSIVNVSVSSSAYVKKGGLAGAAAPANQMASTNMFISVADEFAPFTMFLVGESIAPLDSLFTFQCYYTATFNLGASGGATTDWQGGMQVYLVGYFKDG